MKSAPENPGARRKALGRGLDALLGAKKPAATPTPAPVATEPAEPPALPEGIDGQVRRVPLSLIVVNPEQPRTEFDPAALEELAASIRVEGVIQPILVRPNGDRSPPWYAASRTTGYWRSPSSRTSNART